jgi:hypothetical protein
MHICTRMHVCMYLSVQTWTYTYIHMPIHMGMCMCPPRWLSPCLCLSRWLFNNPFTTLPVDVFKGLTSLYLLWVVAGGGGWCWMLMTLVNHVGVCVCVCACAALCHKLTRAANGAGCWCKVASSQVSSLLSLTYTFTLSVWLSVCLYLSISHITPQVAHWKVACVRVSSNTKLHYVCMCIYIAICAYMYVFITCIYIYILCICIYIYIYIYIYGQTHSSPCICEYIDLHLYMHTYSLHICLTIIYTHIYKMGKCGEYCIIYICIYTYTYTHAHRPSDMLLDV